jgi:hypothetical protein
VEISDATLTLREYVPENLLHRALEMAARAGYPTESRAAVAEAAWLKTAVLIAPHSTPQGGAHPEPGGVGMDPSAELQWICQVSHAYDRCPDVAAFAFAEAASTPEQNRNLTA